MEPSKSDIAQLAESIQLLAGAVQAGEHRMRRAEAWNRRLTAGLLAVVGLATYLGYYAVTAPFAQARPQDPIARIGQDAEHLMHDEAAKAKAWEAQEKAKFDHMIANVRADLNKAEKFDPLHSVAILLKDMRDMLEAVPRMADNMDTMNTAMTEMNHKMGAMPAMAVDMHQMNGKMGVMSYGVDSTMGRMGRMMPWMP